MVRSMAKEKTLVFLGAHPDDESFGPGSTLAQYALAGVKVYIICATGGEAGTSVSEYNHVQDSIKEHRASELDRAVKALGAAGLYRLGYRDSGMRGSEENKHPDCLAMAPLDEVTGRIVKIFREIKPDVVITHDEGGGYGHPDHIATHNATVKAFQAAADPKQYPEAGPAFNPGKLYYYVRPAGSLRVMIKLMPLWGQDPRHFGRNKDIDLTQRLREEYPVNAVIRLKKKSVEARNAAAASHASQGGGRFGSGPFRIIRFIDGLKGPRDYYMRGFPSQNGRHKEKDLFEGIG